MKPSPAPGVPDQPESVLRAALRIDVRLILLGAGFAMAVCAGHPLAIFDAFARGMGSSLVAPICAAMGFAAIVSATGCDRHLVQLLLAPMNRIGWLMLPGTILAAYVVNAAIPSQAAAAAAIGPIVIPLLLANGIRAVVAGAALLLGASFGGDLLNPGDQNVQAVVGAIGVTPASLNSQLLPSGIAGILVAGLVFAIPNRRRHTEEPLQSTCPATSNDTLDMPRLNFLKAAVPITPIALLLFAYGGWAPLAWLLETPGSPDTHNVHGVLPVVRAMLIGSVIAALVSWRDLPRLPGQFFDGMAGGYGKIISMIITAQCFGAGLASLGVSRLILDYFPGGPMPLSIVFPWGLAVVSGSGSGPIFTFAETFLKELTSTEDVTTHGALCCQAGSFGRTMSPVAPVVIYCSGLVSASPFTLVRLVIPALLAGAVVSLGMIWMRS